MVTQTYFDQIIYVFDKVCLVECIGKEWVYRMVFGELLLKDEHVVHVWETFRCEKMRWK